MKSAAAFCLLLLAGAAELFAQEDVEIAAQPAPSYDSIRAKYIQTFPDHFFIWPVIKQRRLEFDLNASTRSGPSLAYRSNKPYTFGIGMYLFELGLEFTFDVPIDEESKFIYGESDARDLQLNVVGKKWGIDLYSQKYSGFYIDQGAGMLPGIPYPQRGDIETRNIGAGINYTFNNKKFSFRSAFNFADRQLKSAGSFLMFASLSSFRAQGDSSLIDPKYSSEFGGVGTLQQIRTTMLAVAPGYTYNLIYKNVFVNGTLAFGPAHNWLYYQLADESSQYDIKFNSYLVLRVGLGYNGEKIFGGLSFITQSHAAKFENVEFSSTIGTFKVLVGYRFAEFGILKKRIWDIPKALF